MVYGCLWYIYIYLNYSYRVFVNQRSTYNWGAPHIEAPGTTTMFFWSSKSPQVRRALDFQMWPFLHALWGELSAAARCCSCSHRGASVNYGKSPFLMGKSIITMENPL